MLAALRLARTAGLLAIVLAVVGSVSACGSKSLVDNFTSQIRADDFQASGPITGSFTMAAQGITVEVTLSGTMKVKGGDNAQKMTMSMAATDATPAATQTNESVSVGDWTYSRDEGGDWTKEARDNDNEDLGSVIKTVTVVDKGVETHYGQELHRLVSSEALDPEVFFSDMTGISDPDLTLTFWAKDDGTPAGLTVEGTYTMDENGTPVDVTLTLDYQFQNLSGVTIEAPSM
jgi:hypothetical protein